MTFQEELISWRLKMGYSQDGAAQTLGVSRSAISSWERGTHEPMPLQRASAEKIMRQSRVRYQIPENSTETVRAVRPASEIARTVAIEHIDEQSGRVLLRISYLVEAGEPMRVIVGREKQTRK